MQHHYLRFTLAAILVAPLTFFSTTSVENIKDAENYANYISSITISDVSFVYDKESQQVRQELEKEIPKFMQASISKVDPTVLAQDVKNKIISEAELKPEKIEVEIVKEPAITESPRKPILEPAPKNEEKSSPTSLTQVEVVETVKDSENITEQPTTEPVPEKEEKDAETKTEPLKTTAETPKTELKEKPVTKTEEHSTKVIVSMDPQDESKKFEGKELQTLTTKGTNNEITSLDTTLTVHEIKPEATEIEGLPKGAGVIDGDTDATYDVNSAIEMAYSEVGTSRPTGWSAEGECIMSVKRWVSVGGKGNWGPGGTPKDNYTGAREIPIEDIKAGDVVQYLYTDSPSSWVGGIHTVFITGVNSDGTYKIVESNNPGGSGLVSKDDSWKPKPPSGFHAIGYRF